MRGMAERSKAGGSLYKWIDSHSPRHRAYAGDTPLINAGGEILRKTKIHI